MMENPLPGLYRPPTAQANKVDLFLVTKNLKEECVEECLEMKVAYSSYFLQWFDFPVIYFLHFHKATGTQHLDDLLNSW